MNAQQHKRIKEVFGELCDRTPAERRRRLRALSDNDPTLAHDVEILLKHSDTPAFDLDDVAQLSSFVEAFDGVLMVDASLPPRIGVYDIIDEIGQGGMGVVYLAQQREPLERRVAIKVIRPGMDSRQVLTRFDMERRTLAAMNHPGIAAIHDAGVTGEGRPYFVMQHVEGERITTYCDAHRLTIDQRLDLFLKVCDAVTHAHQKGVIHRDLKPSNILIEERDGEAVPKVIDFGVAKAMSSSVGEETLHTAPGQLIGTPQYMSPEQTQMDGVHVDTRSDVFSLGALLYELLSGSTPIDAATLRSASFDQVCRMIREVEPAPPSRRIEHLEAPDASTVARHRNTTVSELKRMLRGELDWITRTAMAKEPQRRYESVSALAADIERHRRHEPVSAGPVSAGYRLRKFVRRNLAAVIATCAVTLAAIVVVVTVTIGAIAYGLQAQETAREAENNKQIVEFMNDLFTMANPNKAQGADTTVREFMDEASERLRNDDTLPDEVRASLHNTIGASYAGLGDYATSESHVRKAWELFERTRGATDSRTLRAAANMVHVLDLLDREEEAAQIGLTWMPVAEAVLGPTAYETRMFLTNMAVLEHNLGNLEEAERYYRLALERDRAASEGDPAGWLQAMSNLTHVLIELGRLDEGDAIAEECLELSLEVHGEAHARTLAAMNNLAALRQRQQRNEEAYELSVRTVEISKRILGRTHPDTLSRTRNLAILTIQQDKPAEVEALLAPVYDEAVEAHGYAHHASVGVAELLVTSIAFQDRFDEASTIALRHYDEVIASVDASHALARRTAMLVAHVYDSWEKPDEHRAWLIKAGEEPPSEQTTE